MKAGIGLRRKVMNLGLTLGYADETVQAAENFTLELRRYLWLENICQGQFIYGS